LALLQFPEKQVTRHAATFRLTAEVYPRADRQGSVGLLLYIRLDVQDLTPAEQRRQIGSPEASALLAHGVR
jgi:hypothetical protein